MLEGLLVLFAMGLDGSPLWSTIDSIVREEGVQLFDIDLPPDTSRGGALKVFITRPKGSGANVDGDSVPEPADADSEQGDNHSQRLRIPTVGARHRGRHLRHGRGRAAKNLYRARAAGKPARQSNRDGDLLERRHADM